MAILSFEEFVKKAGGKPEDIKVVGNVPMRGEESQPGYIERVGNAFSEEFRGGKESFIRGAELRAGGDILGGTVRAGLGTAGAATRAIFSPVTEALAPIVTPFIQKALGGEKTQEVLGKINTWAEQNPDAASNLKDIFSIAMAVIGPKGAKVTAKVASPVAGKAAGAGARGLERAGIATQAVGEKVFEQGVPISMREAGMLQTFKAKYPLLQRFLSSISGGELKGAPRIAATTALEQGMGGTKNMLGVQARRASSDIWQGIVSPALKATKIRTNMPTFFKELEARIIKNTPELSKKGDLLEGLESLKNEYRLVRDVFPEKLQAYKEGWAKPVPEKYYRGKDISGIRNEINAMASDLAREKIHTMLGPKAKQAYIDYGNLKGLAELGQKAMTKGEFKGGFGGFMSTLLTTGITPIATFGGQAIYKTGQGLEFIGKIGAKKIGDLFSN